jgi:perosamine synthetase
MTTLANQTVTSKLAIEGGSPVRTAPWPARQLFGEAEKAAAVALFDRCIAQGEAYGYEGAEEKGYCAEFVQSQGGGYADLVNSGSSAVFVALRALGLPPFSEVVVSPCTDPGGVMPVAMLGMIPVPADAAPRSFNTSAEQIAKRITPRTSAILVAHIAGQSCDMDPIMELAKKHNLKVIEDCAQAHGATYKGKPVGTFGHIAAFSTMFGKHHATGGQGGIVYTKDAELHWQAKRCADRGKAFNIPNSTGNVLAAINLNQDEMGATIGRVQLRKLPAIVEARRKFVKRLVELTSDLHTIRPVTDQPNSECSYWFLFYEVNLSKITCDKMKFAEAITAEGVPMIPSYIGNVCDMPWYRERRVLGEPGFPWNNPLYKGDASVVYDTPNLKATLANWTRMLIHENCGEQEAIDVASALRKVEARYIK